ncbi:MAG TPA: TonB-dependent receptor, partial [Ferruginibacter sp.]|nr:TonB-dependent receptor [Ferruginibacter sp.]
QTHNLGMDFGVKSSMFRLSLSYFDQDGIIPKNTYKRTTVRLANTTKFGKLFDISPAVTYIKTENNKVLRGPGGFLLGLLAWPSTNDITASQGDNASKFPLFSANPNSDVDNPLFNVNQNKSREETDRINTTLGININPLSWLTLAGRFGYEMYKTDGYLRYHPQSFYLTIGQGGLQDNYYRRYHGYNHTITATARKTYKNDFNFRLMAGTMWQDYKTEMFSVSGDHYIDSVSPTTGKMWKNGQIITAATYDQVTGSPADSNTTRVISRTRLLQNAYGEFNELVLRELAYFGEFAFNYKNLIYLNYTHRFEQASTLPKKNRNFNYPGGSVSIIVSDLVPGLKNKVLSYWKIRSSLAGTARLNTPYSTQSVFVNNLSSGGGFVYGFTNNNPELLPEKQKTFEIGTEFRLLNSRISFDGAYYNTLNKGQIVENFRLSYATGYVLNTQNAGSTRNQGIEMSVDATLVKRAAFTWNMKINYNHMWNKVVELPKNLSEYYIADTNVFGNVRGGIALGGSTTTMTGFDYLKNNTGTLLINPSTGLPVIDANNRIIGDRNPDFTMGWLNTFTMKNWKLNFLWDIRVGGDVWNGTKQYLTTIGRSKVTADRMAPRVIQGVLQDGLENTATPTVNTISVTPYYNDNYYRLMPEAAFVEKDINWMRLKDVTLSYTFPSSMVRRLKAIKNLGAFVTATDVLMITNYSGADPGVNANSAGTRGVGSFGFDYGTLPAQLGLNFGIRASF